jgi:hypothetical protein
MENLSDAVLRPSPSEILLPSTVVALWPGGLFFPVWSSAGFRWLGGVVALPLVGSVLRASVWGIWCGVGVAGLKDKKTAVPTRVTAVRGFNEKWFMLLIICR